MKIAKGNNKIQKFTNTLLVIMLEATETTGMEQDKGNHNLNVIHAVHHSLNIKAPIRVFIFENRIEIHSLGTLPNGLTIEDIKNGTSMPRNMFLFTNTNYLLPYTGAGSGVRRALEYNPNAIFSNGVESKEITHAANEFVITIPRNSNQAHSENNLVTEESNQAHQKSNQAHSESNLVTEESNQVHANLVTRKLTKKEEDIRNFCSVPRTAQEIMERLGISNQSKNRQKYIVSLIEIGVLERTIPEKPSDPNQKYRRKNKTEKELSDKIVTAILKSRIKLCI